MHNVFHIYKLFVAHMYFLFLHFFFLLKHTIFFLFAVSYSPAILFCVGYYNNVNFPAEGRLMAYLILLFGTRHMLTERKKLISTGKQDDLCLLTTTGSGHLPQISIHVILLYIPSCFYFKVVTSVLKKT